MKINLTEVVGKGYGTFWNCKALFRVCKGSRRSKKSKTTALNLITRLIQYPQANILVVRKTYATLKQSCFTELKWAINRLGVRAFFKITETPLEITYLPTGQKILFRGLDDELKVTSVTVEHGVLCWGWIEEAYELTNEEAFDTLTESLMGFLPEGYFRQWTLTFNPWNEKHWLKKRFFDVQSSDVFAMTTNYTCNEFLSEQDKKTFEQMKIKNPRRYQVAGLGNWGVEEGLIFENWEVKEFDKKELIRQNNNGYLAYKPLFGLDFGFSVDPTAFVAALVKLNKPELYIFDEIYQRGLTNKEIYNAIRQKEYHKQLIIADCEDPRTINELQILGLSRIRAAKKGADSIRAGIQRLQDYKIFVHPSCTNFETEIGSYRWSVNKFGEQTGTPVEGNDHLLDALRYATEGLHSDNFSF